MILEKLCLWLQSVGRWVQGLKSLGSKELCRFKFGRRTNIDLMAYRPRRNRG
jgi:hypothetical protein